jgi:hypothetical protein
MADTIGHVFDYRNINEKLFLINYKLAEHKQFMNKHVSDTDSGEPLDK